ncbi:hypothetical protein GCM10017567_35390 [Amycolatopsis bullii]|uniref:Uncharacterized protein n=1 Tax=Amycolatopsis bullii TaxID=941987 RepID=A0ABQ3KCI8_9PSEU|nr:hypothetical protein GCM10017567_35390 [Amycolatopsis bullii]
MVSVRRRHREGSSCTKQNADHGQDLLKYRIHRLATPSRTVGFTARAYRRATAADLRCLTYRGDVGSPAGRTPEGRGRLRFSGSSAARVGVSWTNQPRIWVLVTGSVIMALRLPREALELSKVRSPGYAPLSR